MANVLPFRVRCSVVRALCEGNGIRETARLTSTDKDTVTRLGATVGNGCAAFCRRIAGRTLPVPPEEPRCVASTKASNRRAMLWLHHFWRTFVQASTDGSTVATRAGLAHRAWSVEDMTRTALALEDVGETPADPAPSGTTPKARRRYQRKTHALAAGDARAA